MTPPPTGRLLVADDEEMYRNLVVRHLTARGHTCEATGDGRHAIALASTGQFDVVLADLRMPGADGLTIAREVVRAVPTVPVVLVTGHASLDHVVRAVRYGCSDLLLKPFHLDVLDECVARALGRRKAFRDTEEYQRALEKRIEGLTAQAVHAAAAPSQPASVAEPPAAPADAAPVAEDVRDAVALGALADAADLRAGIDPGHGRRTRALAELVAERLRLERDDVRAVSLGALLHDAGLLLLADAAVAPPEERTPDGQSLFQRHPVLGADLLRRAGVSGTVTHLVESHHEHWDGSGFPRGLRGDQIPLAARVIAVADGADEFLSASPSRGAAELEAFLLRGRGARFGPECADALLSLGWDAIHDARSRASQAEADAPVPAAVIG